MNKVEKIIELLKSKNEPLSAREITDILYGTNKHQSIVYGKLMEMNKKGLIVKTGAGNSYKFMLSNGVAKSLGERTMERSIYPVRNVLSNEDVKHIVSAGIKFYEDLRKDKHARYLSWEHCYKAFQKFQDKVANEEDIDYLSLQLAFYLASWGMYRGSSFLLQKDYKVHIEVVKELLRNDYKGLWGIEYSSYRNNEITDKLKALNQRITEIYVKHRGNIDGMKSLSDVLITKILLGTLGCVPAYDRYFTGGIKSYKVASGNYNINSVLAMVDFYERNYDTLEQFRQQINKGGLVYPQMKILDMCFWQVGYDMDMQGDDNALERL